jgi:GT2 family glycosyltransferase
MDRDTTLLMTKCAQPILTVIVLNWNGAAFLPRCFQSLRLQTLRNLRVLLVDNDSTDDSLELTRRDFPK